MLTQERLREIIKYDPQAGTFEWIVAPSGHAVGPAGYVHTLGYRYICISRKRYKAHRLAWFYMTGEWPDNVDHKNGNRSDNRWTNLRNANKAENGANMRRPSHNTSGFKGVSLHKQTGKWRSYIKDKQQYIHLGLWPTPEAAHQAYRSEATKRFGVFARFD